MGNKLSTPYTVSAKALSAIHVGGGQDFNLDPLSYSLHGDWFYHINMARLFEEQPLFAEKFVALSEGSFSIIALRNLVHDFFDPTLRETWVFRSRASQQFQDEYKAKLSDANNQLLVQCMLHAGNQAVIPGSSIKGSIRTAILDCRSSDEQKNAIKRKLYVKNRKSGIDELDRNAAQIAEGHILMNGRFDIPLDPFRALKISDALLPEDSTEIVKILNSAPDASAIPMWVEVVKKGCEFNFDCTLLHKEGKHLERINSPITHSEVMISCTEYFQTALYLEDEKFYEKYQHEAHALVDDIAGIYEDNQDNLNFTIIRVGRFSHLESMTFTPPLRIPEESHPKGWGKTRNLLNGKLPLGFLSCEFIEKVL